MLRVMPIALLAATLLLFALPALAQTAYYTATFEATWTAETHPQEYPGNAHFSGLVGGTHNAAVQFWQEGEMASLGIKHMAEWGTQSTLLGEVQDAIDAGQAQFQLSDSPLWTVPGATSFGFEITPGFPLVTLVAMIAPSPDWFVGVEGLDLRPGGQWASQITVDLYAWDAGTDSGQGYSSGDSPTNPPVPIFAITDGPFTPGVPIGTLTFTLAGVASVPEAAGLRARAYPNPFNPRTTIAWELPQEGPLRVEVFDVRGRQVAKLWDRRTAAGPGRVQWNGQDDSGRMQPSGKYFYRIDGGGIVRTGALVMLQ